MSYTTRAYLEYEQYTEHDREFRVHNRGGKPSQYSDVIDILIGNGFDMTNASIIARELIKVHGNEAYNFAVDRMP